jgi:hypothetical protein
MSLILQYLFNCNSVVNNAFGVWNLRLGHLSKLVSQDLSKQFSFVQRKDTLQPCDSCHFSKQKKLPFSHSISSSNAPFDILHVDIWGPYSTDSTLGHKYFLILVDGYSRFTWIIFLKTKTETKQNLVKAITSHPVFDDYYLSNDSFHLNKQLVSNTPPQTETLTGPLNSMIESVSPIPSPSGSA